MSSSLGLTLADAFLANFESNWSQNCPSDLKPYYYRLYVDDIFVLFPSLEHLETLQKFRNDRDANMSFTIESEKQNRISFLDVKIIREDKAFTISAYHNTTFSGGYTHFENFLSSTDKFGTVYTLAYKCFEFAEVGLNHTMNYFV